MSGSLAQKKLKNNPKCEDKTLNVQRQESPQNPQNPQINEIVPVQEIGVAPLKCNLNLPIPSSVSENSDRTADKNYHATNSQSSKRSYMRKVSSFEKKLCLRFDRKTCKVESVEHLLDNRSQWAFNIKVQSLDGKTDQEEYKKSLMKYKRDGLKSIARNLNDLSQQLEIQKPSQHQKSSKAVQIPTNSQDVRPLQIKVKLCEIKRDSLSDIQEASSPYQLSIEHKDVKYNSNRNYIKCNTSKQDERSSSSQCFSDAISSNSQNRGERNIKISEHSIKGIYKNLRKLTEDIIETNDQNSQGHSHNYSSISIEKASPYNSYDKKFRPGPIKVNHRNHDDLISFYSTSGKSPNKKVKFATKKTISVDYDVKYASNDSQRLDKINHLNRIIPKISCSSDLTVISTNQQMQYKNIPIKHKSGNHVQSNSLQVNKLYELTVNSATLIRQNDQMNAAFDFDTKDSFMYGDDEEQLSENYNNENRNAHNNYRKFTHDDSIKQPPILTHKINRRSKNEEKSQEKMASTRR
ncbi:UNKNOWN [Stylonychia lemnae]|uniref:Uncharacterized protein n=1 Tax=Stylonychia lemnae TaxID=5949 RepID=A0A078BAM7_STYLE|nr:UNKNOWN [Stylonychia lemnae]|eukprot:CDW91620.1 UNKNOWN [Stylonychia lemnae]